MRRDRVTSSTVSSIGFDPAGNVLEVEFSSGSVYRYYGVPARVNASFRAAPSKGSYLNREIADVYPYEQVE